MRPSYSRWGERGWWGIGAGRVRADHARCAQYEYYEAVENGDLTQVIPVSGRCAATAGHLFAVLGGHRCHHGFSRGTAV